MGSPVKEGPDGGDGPRKSNKSVRWPEGGSERSASFAYDTHADDDEAGIDDDDDDDGGGYFGLAVRRPRAGTHRGNPRPQFDEEDEEDDASLHETRETTRTNTIFNRRRLTAPEIVDPSLAWNAGSRSPRMPSPGTGPQTPPTPLLQVTPPPERLLGPGPENRLPVAGGVVEGVFEGLGRQSGMAPGALENSDDDPLDREFRARREQVLRALPEAERLAVEGIPAGPPRITGPRAVRSLPASPLLDNAPGDTPEEHIGDIPLQTLDSRLYEVLREQEREREREHDRDRDRDPSTGPSGSYARRPSEQSSLGASAPGSPRDTTAIHSEVASTVSLRGHKRDEKDKSSDETRRELDARQEARDLARELVRAHLAHTRQYSRSGERKSPDNQSTHGFVVNAADLGEDLIEEQLGGTSEPNPDERRDDLEIGQADIPPPQRVREGVLGSLLRLYAEQEDPGSKSQSTLVDSLKTPFGSPSPGATPLMTPAITPSSSPPMHGQSGSSRLPSPTLSASSKFLAGRLPKPALKRPGFSRSHSGEDILGRRREERAHVPKWYEGDRHKRAQSVTSLGALAKSSMQALNAPSSSSATPGKDRQERKKEAQRLAEEKKKRKKAKLAEQRRITIHIADVLQRQRFILRFGRALMLFGAPSHRLEEYLRMTSRVLEIDAQFLYLPGCMLVSFGDATTHTSETRIIRVAQGLNLAKLDATHLIYKEVVHDLMSLEEASARIDDLLKSKNNYPAWLSILFFALATGFISTYGFPGYWPDMPISFVLGGMVGFLQIWVAPRSDLYNNVFEVTSSVLCSFLGRAFGSIRVNGQHVFCFASLTQSSLALILPGYIILCGSLELQSKNLVAGAVRMFYAIIYSMFLAFGIALGAAIYGWMDGDASNEFVCHRTLDDKWKILFVPLAATMLAMVNQASIRQLPTMVLVASAGYTVLYFIQTKINNASSFTSALGAFTIGILGNLYSRIGHGLAFAAMLPGIFVIVPSGVAAQGSLVSGVALANQIVQNTTKDHNNTDGTSSSSIFGNTNGVADLGGTMVQVAVGITVGLFIATLLVYPLGLGKKRSGLFTF